MSQPPGPTPLPIQNVIAQMIEALKAPFAELARNVNQNAKATDRDVEHRMYEQATRASAAYALDHMVTARPLRGNKYGAGGRFDLLEYAMSFAKLDGIYAEFGVFQGETLTFIANHVDKVVYGFDSFEGLPADWFLGVTQGTFSLKGQLPKLAIPQGNFRLVKGLFGETLPSFVEQIAGPVAFLNIDCDLYESTKSIFDGFGDRIVAGTVIVFDEYFNYPGWQKHEFKAFGEFCAERGVTYRYLAFTPARFGVAVLVESVGKTT